MGGELEGRDRDGKTGKPPKLNLNGNEMTSSQEWRLNLDRSWTNHVHNVTCD